MHEWPMQEEDLARHPQLWPQRHLGALSDRYVVLGLALFVKGAVYGWITNRSVYFLSPAVMFTR